MIRLVVLSLLTGCLDALAPEVGPVGSSSTTCDDDLDPARAVSFSGAVLPILQRDCQRCHRPGGEGQQKTGLDLSSYGTLRAGGSRSIGTIVIDGAPCTSILWQKVGPAPPFGVRMPKGGPAMSAADRQLIHDWIAEGAHDD